MSTANLPPQRVYDTLHRGMRLFQDDRRELAVEPLVAVLHNPQGFPSWRLAAAGLLAEVYRGQGDFLRAEHYYRIALAEANVIPEAERTRNEWYLHYRPRCALGSITVLRRLLSTDHRTIAAELRATRDLVNHVTIEDLSGQLSAIEGVYRRQRGDLDGAARLLQDACLSLAGRSDICYWELEHVEALLLQVQLLTCSGRALVARSARKLLIDPSVRAWSKAVAAACHLHLRFDRMVESRMAPARFAEMIRDHSESGVGRLLEILTINAQDDGDPLLISEALILGLAWEIAAEQPRTAMKYARPLAECVRNSPKILGVLRACEVRTLAALAPGATCMTRCFDDLVGSASESLAFLHASITSYGYGADKIDAWATLLNLESATPSDLTLGWLDGPVTALRCLAWP